MKQKARDKELARVNSGVMKEIKGYLVFHPVGLNPDETPHFSLYPAWAPTTVPGYVTEDKNMMPVHRRKVADIHVRSMVPQDRKGCYFCRIERGKRI